MLVYLALPTYAARMYRDLLQQIAIEQGRVGGGAQSPCSATQLERLARRVRVEFDTAPPPEYMDFLAQTDGLDWNGVVVYASEPSPIVGRPDRSIAGIVEMNLAFRDDPRFHDLLVLGSDGMDIYAYRMSSGEYQAFDEVPHQLVLAHPSFEDMMMRMPAHSLQ